MRPEPDSAAAALFVDRASAVAPRSLVGRPDDDAVVEICRRLDGIPLAIELAASRLLSMTVAEMRDRLDDRFRLLVGSRRGLERHQTLRHAVQWSYDLLDDAEKCAVEQVFGLRGRIRRSLGAHARRRIAETSSRRWICSTRWCANRFCGTDQSAGRTRFSMLETIRQFAEEQLVATVRPRSSHGTRPVLRGQGNRTVWRVWDSPRQREAYDWFDSRVGEPTRRLSVGCRSTMTSTPLPPSPSTRPFLGLLARAVRAAYDGSRNSSTRRTVDDTVGSHSCTSWRRSASLTGRSRRRPRVIPNAGRAGHRERTIRRGPVRVSNRSSERLLRRPGQAREVGRSGAAGCLARMARAPIYPVATPGSRVAVAGDVTPMRRWRPPKACCDRRHTDNPHVASLRSFAYGFARTHG